VDLPERTYRRILLKLSGEALLGSEDYGIDPAVLSRIAEEIREVLGLGVEVGVVLGGGNIFRGAGLAARGMDRVTGDQMGMLATVMNALAMQDALGRIGVDARVMSALPIGQVCENFDRRQAIRHLEKGRIVIFAAGTGNPFFTTDSAASLRAAEIGADLLIKATKVPGIFSDDPLINPDARFYPRLSYDQVLREGLGVMDATAIVLCRDHGLPLRVMNIYDGGALVACRGAVKTLAPWWSREPGLIQ
jgi:uridylate kinase